jgi:hypothetical protein
MYALQLHVSVPFRAHVSSTDVQSELEGILGGVGVGKNVLTPTSI